MTFEVLQPTGGHVLDVESLELNSSVLSLARNVHMRRGFPSRIRGRRAIYGAPISTLPLHLLNFTLNDFNWWLVFGTGDIQAYETSNLYQVDIPSQTAVVNPHEWSSTLLNGIPVYTNGKNIPHYWTGDSADDSLPLPDWPSGTTCRFVVAFRFHIFALDIDGPSGHFNNMIMWSDATEPGAIPQSWTAAADNEAGSAFLADSVGRCVAGAPLGTQLMIYKPGSFHAVEYAGQQPDNIFVVRPVVRATGLVGPHALSVIGTSHAVVGNDDVVLSDGINVHSIADKRIKQTLKNSIDPTNKENVFTIFDNSSQELWVCVPETGSQFATIAHIWDKSSNTWTSRDLNQVRYGTTGYVTDVAATQNWDSDSQVWNADVSVWNETPQAAVEQVTVAGPANNWFVEDVPETTLVNAFIQRTDLIFGDDSQIKVTSRVYIEGTGIGLSTLTFRLGARNSTDENITWGAFVTREDGGCPYEVSGRFISVEVGNSDSAEAWTVTRIKIEAAYDGSF